MKKQITRLSPHQNAKVFGILMAISSLIFVVPMSLMFSFMPSGIDAHGNPFTPPSAALFLIFPIAYLVLGYLMTAIGCVFYNFMFKFIGGIEYESSDQEA